MKDLFLTCSDLLESGEDIVMITIIDQEGSSPRTAGSKMLVRRDGTIYGTIGGGIFEANAVKMAQNVFQNGQSMTREFQFSGGEASSMDMICGGSAKIFVDLLRSACPENSTTCRTIGNLTRSDQEACLVTKIDTTPGGADRIKLTLLSQDSQSQPLGMPLTKEDREALTPLIKGRHPQRVTLGDAHYLIEPVHYLGTVYIFGAGHVSQKLASLTSFVGFQTVVLDDRAQYANKDRFPDAGRIIVAEDMGDCMKDLPINKNSYIVIVTRGHAYDMVVLKQALQTDAGYIGMIGSKRKRDMIYEHLRQSGVSEEALSGVHAPIGTRIDAETPEEIAVSIVGELILARAKVIDG
jgi:xanthine dehydrogenase accessory factor